MEPRSPEAVSGGPGAHSRQRRIVGRSAVATMSVAVPLPPPPCRIPIATATMSHSYYPRLRDRFPFSLAALGVRLAEPFPRAHDRKQPRKRTGGSQGDDDCMAIALRSH